MGDPVTTPLDALIRLFAFGLYLERDAAERLLTREGVNALEALNTPTSAGSGRPAAVFGTVALVPVPGALAASDRVCFPEQRPSGRAPDGVYPYFRQYTGVCRPAPETPCETLLEVSTGQTTQRFVRALIGLV